MHGCVVSFQAQRKNPIVTVVRERNLLAAEGKIERDF